MTHPILSRIPLFGKFVDERFLEHRRRSSSAAGLAGALLTLIIFEYRLFHDNVVRWDLFTIVMLMVVVKISMMLWYRFSG